MLATALLLGKGFYEILFWTAFAVFTTILMDLDHLFIAYLVKETRGQCWKQKKWPQTITDIRGFTKGIVWGSVIMFFSHLFGELFLPVAVSLSLRFLADLVDSAFHPEER